MRLLVVAFTAVLLIGTGSIASAQGRMVKTEALVHVVANLDTSMGFYRDAIGFELLGPPAPLERSALVALARAGAPRASARAASFRIPGSEMQFMLVEFRGADGKPFDQRLYDPGVTRFSIQVRDIDAAFARVKGRVRSVDLPHGVRQL